MLRWRLVANNSTEPAALLQDPQLIIFQPAPTPTGPDDYKALKLTYTVRMAVHTNRSKQRCIASAGLPSPEKYVNAPFRQAMQSYQ